MVTEIERIDNLLKKHLFNLSLLETNIDREEKHNIKEIIYTLDFSEIHAYIHPTIQQNMTWAEIMMIRDMLDNPGNRRFILLPATIEEMLIHVSKIIKNEGFWKRWRYRRFIKGKEVQEFIDAFEKKKDHTEIYNLYVKMKKRYPYIIEFLEREVFETTPLKRLQILLLKKNNIIWVDKMGINPQKIGLNIELMKDTFEKLNLYRKGKDRVNWVDAYNFGLTYTLNEKYYNSEKKYFNIVTHSEIPISIYKQIKWINDPLFKDSIRKNECAIILREPTNCVYDIIANRKFPDRSQRKEYIQKGIKRCNLVRKELSTPNKYRSALQKKTSFNKEELEEIVKILTDFTGNKYRLFFQFINEEKGIYSDLAFNWNKTPERIFEGIMNEENLIEKIERAHISLKKDVYEMYEVLSDIVDNSSNLNIQPHITEKIKYLGELLEKDKKLRLKVGDDISSGYIVRTPEDFKRYQNERKPFWRKRK